MSGVEPLADRSIDSHPAADVCQVQSLVSIQIVSPASGDPSIFNTVPVRSPEALSDSDRVALARFKKLNG
ncbi:hypothetical protein [Anabaenopsis elenkinii]|uniref:Uncharacterized protein n=1 Tax=Anabaenopsis elenkinii CCIBt3563 TaxID=2779889 RepID=A0A7S6U6Z3_9CYAN|nr:hypothetical protein [Anabaenopsis elenkinii]QOV24178.1 hypothetical protein IM676_08025 [Anabaenopsis elenkinii CCIBt3563]